VSQYKIKKNGGASLQKGLKMSIKKVSKNESLDIIENRLPLGIFYSFDNKIYIGIDNRAGHAWTEEFKTLESCERWLNYGLEEDDEYY
jgi:hypothetical protein